ncbi:MAG: zinc metalloprotease HtpX [Methanobacterium sp.]|uniref:zinc metalloprotease HtpX n=1 Tax=Methanobacterium sp. TaxID=2164 RepID=UPI003D64993F|nr:zinc metalloprotease HtpX [Methanobacterium sp.]
MFDNIKILLLFSFLTGLLIGIGYLIGSFFKVGILGALIFFLFAIALNFASYFYSDKIVLKMYGARIVSEEEAPELHSIVEELAMNAGIPKPKVAIVENSTPNAFATGRNPQNAVVAVTTGILNLLNKDELEGVIGHELGHVKNRDILISAVAATIAGAIIIVADYARFFAIFGGGDDAEGIIGIIAMTILAPIAAIMVQFAISRSREYKADESGAQISGNPLALADALNKLQMSVNTKPMDANPATAHMFIVNPFGGKSKTLLNLFSTHPPMDKRIKRLEELRTF